MQKQISPKITILTLGTLIVFGIGVSFNANAGIADNVFGYAWSENIGWISFNCTNQDTCGTVDYGVNINESGEFSGYAWSENIGWIDFSPLGPYPSNPNYSVKLNSDNSEIAGWARVLNYGDGWDGWIKLRKGVADSGSDYGVSIDAGTGEFSGWAWGDTVVGWISFKGVVYGVTTSFSFNKPPNQPGIPGIYQPSGVTWDNCTFQGKSIPTFHWTYSDPNNDPQTAYEIRMKDNAGFPKNPDPTEFTDSITGEGTSYNPSHRLEEWTEWMDWNMGYWWIVRVKDDNDSWSEWLEPTKFDTPIHAYPFSDFTWFPEEPNQKETVIFTPDASGFYYLWTITQGEATFVDSTGPTNEEPHINFESTDNKIMLRVTDNDAYWCESDEEKITAQLPLPEYHEITPIIWLKDLMAAITKFFNGGF